MQCFKQFSIPAKSSSTIEKRCHRPQSTEIYHHPPFLYHLHVSSLSISIAFNFSSHLLSLFYFITFLFHIIFMFHHFPLFITFLSHDSSLSISSPAFRFPSPFSLSLRFSSSQLLFPFFSHFPFPNEGEQTCGKKKEGGREKRNRHKKKKEKQVND